MFQCKFATPANYAYLLTALHSKLKGFLEDQDWRPGKTKMKRNKGLIKREKKITLNRPLANTLPDPSIDLSKDCPECCRAKEINPRNMVS